MRTIGFVLVVIGVAVIYLGWNGKIGRAMTALLTGNDPGSSSSSDSSGSGSIPWKAPSQTIETNRANAKKSIDNNTSVITGKTKQDKSFLKGIVDKFYGPSDT